jgi:hypothetical protein
MTTSAMDRVHFLEAQRRNRRRSLRFMVFAVVAVALAAARGQADVNERRALTDALLSGS